MKRPHVRAISQHALDRFLERSRIRTPNNALAILFRLAQRCEHLNGDRWHANGWILVISGDELVTVYRPSATNDVRRIRASILRRTVRICEREDGIG